MEKGRILGNESARSSTQPRSHFFMIVPHALRLLLLSKFSGTMELISWAIMSGPAIFPTPSHVSIWGHPQGPGGGTIPQDDWKMEDLNSALHVVLKDLRNDVVTFRNLLKSFPGRLAAVRRAGGGTRIINSLFLTCSVFGVADSLFVRRF